MLPFYLKVSPSITPKPMCNTSQTDSSWMLSIMKYLQTGKVPGDKKQTHKLYTQAECFTLINDQLYRRSFEGSYLKCLNEPNAKYSLIELHEGVCGNRSGRQTLAHRAYAQGYYWPTMKQDAKSYVKRCDWCQRHTLIPRVSFEALDQVTIHQSFVQ